MKISFFCIATEPLKNKYPVEESIRSVLPLCDEVVVVLGRTEKASEKILRNLSKKIRIFYTSLWPIDWSYDVMTYHFDYALKKCTGDYCVKFDIDYVFDYNTPDILRNILEKNSKYHKLTFRKYNYIDRNHWMILDRGPYVVNTKLLMEESGDRDSFYIGNKNYMNELIMEGKMNEKIYGGDDLRVFNYDCTFMDFKLFYEKHYRWYNAYFKKWGNLDHFGMKRKFLENREQFVDFIIKRTRERIVYSIKKKRIYFDNKNFNPELIRDRLGGIKREMYGYNFFGKINLNKLLYNTYKVDKIKDNYNLIKNYLVILNNNEDFLKGCNKENIINGLKKCYKKKKWVKITKFIKK